MADRKLFIGNLVRRITQEDLWVMYSTFGPLEECAKFHESFGFVRFLHAEDARKALKATQGMTLKGRCIKVEFAATTTSWRSSYNSHGHESRSTVRYNIPPIRAADLTSQRGLSQNILNNSSLSLSPPNAASIGCRRTSHSKSSKNFNSELNSSPITSKDNHPFHKSFSSPTSSNAASSSHLTEIDDYDCDLDSGYNDEHDSPLLSSSSITTTTYLIPTSPWYDMPLVDEMFVWDFQLYADIARDLPLIKTENSSFESIDDEKLTPNDYLPQLNIEEYL